MCSVAFKARKTSCSHKIAHFFFFLFGGWIRLGKAGTLLLGPYLSPFCSGYFGDGGLMNSFAGRKSESSKVARITGVSHHDFF
jgi:hypothetical protein